jgi:hypothetical protein
MSGMYSPRDNNSGVSPPPFLINWKKKVKSELKYYSQPPKSYKQTTPFMYKYTQKST